jgi:hypothetical protein
LTFKISNRKVKGSSPKRLFIDVVQSLVRIHGNISVEKVG